MAASEGVGSRQRVAQACRCEGDGLSVATVREHTVFKVVARDEQGNSLPLTDGLAVNIRGAELGVALRTKVIDNKDGSFTVAYTPVQSGEYRIDVSIADVKLPGSPFTCIASTRTPHPPHCVIAGEALRKAISREPQHVEVRSVHCHLHRPAAPASLARPASP